MLCRSWVGEVLIYEWFLLVGTKLKKKLGMNSGNLI